MVKVFTQSLTDNIIRSHQRRSTTPAHAGEWENGDDEEPTVLGEEMKKKKWYETLGREINMRRKNGMLEYRKS